MLGKKFGVGILILSLFGLIQNGTSTERDSSFQGKYESGGQNAENQSEIGKKVVPEPSSCLHVEWSDRNCQIGPFSIRTDIAEKAFRQLCPDLTGKFEAPSSCDLYITCHWESLTVNRCPASFHFNSKVQDCVEAQTYECSHPVVENPNTILNHTKKTSGNRPKRALVSFESDISNPKSRVGESHIISKRSIKSNGNCPTDYIRPHPGSCTKFLICSNGKFFEQDCGVGAKFNPLSRVCDLPDSVDCESRISDLGTYDCQPNYVYITSHFLYCNKFIECDHGELYVKTCPGNTVFNAEKSRCDHAYNTPCDKPISFEGDTDVNFLRKTRDVSKYICEFNYIAPIEGVCDEFLECENEKLFRKSCGPGTAYNVLLGQCDWPDNVRASNPQYCARYLQCDGKNYVPRTCQSGTYFNPGSGKCDPGEIVDCTGKLDDPRAPVRVPKPVTPPPRIVPPSTTRRIASSK